MHRLNLNGYEPDRHHEAAVAFCIHAGTDELTSPVHQHRKGQLILALHGAITCTVENALWMVPQTDFQSVMKNLLKRSGRS